jgi:hypothetical protein
MREVKRRMSGTLGFYTLQSAELESILPLRWDRVRHRLDLLIA